MCLKGCVRLRRICPPSAMGTKAPGRSLSLRLLGRAVPCPKADAQCWEEGLRGMKTWETGMKESPACWLGVPQAKISAGLSPHTLSRSLPNQHRHSMCTAHPGSLLCTNSAPHLQTLTKNFLSLLSGASQDIHQLHQFIISVPSLCKERSLFLSPIIFKSSELPLNNDLAEGRGASTLHIKGLLWWDLQ